MHASHIATSVGINAARTIAAMIAEAAIAFALVDPPRAEHVERTPRERLRGIFELSTRAGPLRAIIVFAVLLNLASFIPVWLIQLYALDAGVPIGWLGPIWAVANLSVAAAGVRPFRPPAARLSVPSQSR